MKAIKLNLVMVFLIVIFSGTNAAAKWWIFGQSNDEVSINYLYLNKISYDESGPEVTVYRETLQDGLIHLTGRAGVRKGKIGGIRVTTDNKDTWQEARFSDNGAFEFSFRPEMNKAYVLFVEIMDTAGKTNDIEATRKVVKLSDQNITGLVKETLDSMIDAYQSEDAAGFMKYVSDTFTGDEMNLDRAIRRDFNAFDGISLRYTLNNITAGTGGMVYVSISFARSVISTRDGRPYTDKGITEFVFQLGPARVYNMKNPLIFGLSDAENVATGTVSSSSGELNITLNEKNEVRLTESGTSVGSNVISGTTTLRTTNPVNNFQGFIFADEDVTTETDGGNIVGDFGMAIEAGGPIIFTLLRTGVLAKVKTGTRIEQITTADESGYVNSVDPGVGDSVIFKLSNNTYAAMEIMNVTGGGYPFYGTIKYKYQPDGTRNF